jgi:branched-chain amino acid aminotransferase
LNTITRSDFHRALDASLAGRRPEYYAMYSSVLGGIVTDPALMLIPVDDHVVHRGDGVFDTCKCVDGALYNLDAHLGRLIGSAAAIGLRWPGGQASVRDAILATVRAGGQTDCCVRVILARGPGGFGVSPRESSSPALYVVAYRLPAPFMARHPEGARVRRSTVPAKPPAYAGIKNCNYLPNVLMKAEAEAWDADFAVGFDPDGHLTEGPTENAGIVTREGELRFPRLEYILAGTTMLRVVELATGLLPRRVLRSIAYADVSEDDIRGAAEMLIVGTTLNVVAVREYEGRPVGDGRPGPVFAALQELVENDTRRNSAVRTPVYPRKTKKTAPQRHSPAQR